MGIQEQIKNPMAMSDQSRKHLEGYLHLARTSNTHQRCMENLQYCTGYIGALTIEHRCTLEEHKETYRQIDEIRGRSFSLKASGARS